MTDTPSAGVLSSTVLIVPGLRGEDSRHWQTLLADRLPRVATVTPLETDRLSRHARVAALDRHLQDIDGPVILVAHSAGVLTVAHWAATHRRLIKGALLVTPPDLDAHWPAPYPSPQTMRAEGWLPLPRKPLPFPSLLAASSNDPLASSEATADLARDWHARLVEVGAVGHLNPAAGYGPWRLAETLIGELDC